MISWETMARATGLEPATSGVTGRHSNQLSYARAGLAGTASRRRWDYGAGPDVSSTRAGKSNHAPSRLCTAAEATPDVVRARPPVGGDGLEPPTLSV